MDFDMAPTARLAGFHFKGVVAQRIIANYPVPPETLQPLMPPDAELWQRNGQAWLSACFVQMRHVRPAGVPRRMGVGLRYLVQRTIAMVPFPDGRRRKAVFVLQAYGDPFLPRLAARLVGGAPFQPARIDWQKEGDGYLVRVTQARTVIYEARSSPGLASEAFADVAAADAAILGMAWGSHKNRRWNLFPETHDPWNAYSLLQTTAVNRLRDGLGLAGVEADNVLAMRDCPHEFGRPVQFD